MYGRVVLGKQFSGLKEEMAEEAKKAGTLLFTISYILLMLAFFFPYQTFGNK